LSAIPANRTHVRLAAGARLELRNRTQD
jgi:hypothetical protein